MKSRRESARDRGTRCLGRVPVSSLSRALTILTSEPFELEIIVALYSSRREKNERERRPEKGQHALCIRFFLNSSLRRPTVMNRSIEISGKTRSRGDAYLSAVSARHFSRSPACQASLVDRLKDERHIVPLRSRRVIDAPSVFLALPLFVSRLSLE